MSIMDSIIKYAAGSRMEAGAWNSLVAEVASAYASGQDIKECLTEAEKAFKEATGETSMPTAYRSAKSVVLKAYEYDVQTVDENNQPLGKSAVEKAIKDRVPKNIKTSSDVLEDGLAMLRKGYLMCATEADRVAYKAYIDLHIEETYL